MVNMTDFNSELTEADVNLNGLDIIFNHQHSLAKEYKPTYSKNGFNDLQLELFPGYIDDARSQHIFKYNIYCFTEEMGEALQAFMMGNKHHYFEELIDALHFLTEACINLDVKPDYSLTELFKKSNGYSTSPYSFTHHITELWLLLGVTCNCLKQKPWKSTHQMTDVSLFKKYLNSFWVQFIFLFKLEGKKPLDVVNGFLQKQQVNKFRIESNY